MGLERVETEESTRIPSTQKKDIKTRIEVVNKLPLEEVRQRGPDKDGVITIFITIEEYLTGVANSQDKNVGSE